MAGDCVSGVSGEDVQPGRVFPGAITITLVLCTGTPQVPGLGDEIVSADLITSTEQQHRHCSERQSGAGFLTHR
jgi:hypothetical protein